MATTATTIPGSQATLGAPSNNLASSLVDQPDNTKTASTVVPNSPAPIAAPAPDPMSQGMINSYTPQVATATATPATATGYTAAQQAGAVSSPITQRVIDPEKETVAGQVAGIINANSPIMQQAQATALQRANDRGLGNSSLAVGAAQDAVLSAATPIGTADANVYGNAANLNTTTQNQFTATKDATQNVINGTNTAAVNAASEFGAGAANTASNLNAQLGTNVGLANSGALNAASTTGVQLSAQQTIQQQQIAANKILSDNSLSSQERNAQLSANTQQTIAAMQSETQKIMNDASLSQSDKNAQLSALTQTNIANASNLLSAANTKLTTDTQTAISLANNASAQIVAGLSASSQQLISKLDDENKITLQTDASAATLHAQAMIAIANIQQSPNVSDKAGAIQQVLDTLSNGLSVMGVVGNSLDFSNPTTTDTGGAVQG